MSKALVIIKSMGIGDLSILISSIHAISKKIARPVTVLAQKNTRAHAILKHDPHIEEVIELDEKEIKSFFSIIRKIKPKRFDQSYIYSDSIRLYLISKLSGIKENFHYKFFSKKGKNFFKTAKEFTEKTLNTEINPQSKIYCNNNDIVEAKTKYNISKEYKNIVLAPSASGDDKVWFIDRFIATCEKLNKVKPCKFYIAAGKNDKHLIDKIMNSSIGKNCISFENLTIGETLPIIKNCDGYLGNDTSFLHLSCALGLKCIAIFFNSPVKSYGTYSKNITCVIPEGETLESTVHDLPMGRERISVEAVYNEAIKLLD